MTQPNVAPEAPTLDETTDTRTQRVTTAEDLLAFQWWRIRRSRPTARASRSSRSRDRKRRLSDIVVADRRCERRRARADSGERDGQPRWSPDGKRLAFVRASEPKKPGQIFVLPMEGGERLR
jgi:Tol biopolymer transport system component